ncbi:hypothetical protein [Streptomyces sp. LN704]
MDLEVPSLDVFQDLAGNPGNEDGMIRRTKMPITARRIMASDRAGSVS